MVNYVYFSCIFILDMNRCKIILFLYTIVAEVADLVLDWDFFVEIEKTDAVQDWIKKKIKDNYQKERQTTIKKKDST